MKKLFLFIFALLLTAGLWAAVFISADDSFVLDPALEEAIRQQTGFEGRQLDQKAADSITSLDLRNRNLTSMEGLRHFRNLTELNLSENLLTEANDLEELTALTNLDISDNQISSLELSSPRLKELRAAGNRLSDVSFLTALPEVERLDLQDNRIGSIEAISDLPLLRNLDIRGNRIESLEPLRHSSHLMALDARDNRIRQVEPIAGLLLRDRLLLSGNNLDDAVLLAPKLTAISEHDLDPSAPSVELSQKSGYYDGPVSLSMSAEEPDAVIYYTLDGSEPTVSSARYTSPLTLRKEHLLKKKVLSNIPTSPESKELNLDAETVQYGMTVRAAAYHNGSMGPSTAETYVFEKDRLSPSGLPVLSLTVDPDDLFDEKDGIYVPGNHYSASVPFSGNYYLRGREYEKAAHLTFFEADGTVGFSEPVGVRIHGAATRLYPQKSLRIYARSDYGQSRIMYPIFPDRPELAFSQLLLRNAGNDWASAFMRDRLLHELVEGGPVETQDSRPAIVLINGEYWGLHIIRERYDADYLKETVNLPKDRAVILENDPEAPYGFSVEEGSPDAAGPFNRLMSYVETHELASDEEMETVRSQIDVQNFLHYVAYQLYAANQDSFSNNTAVWRRDGGLNPEAVYGHDGKWRWLLYDTDAGLGRYPDGKEHDTLGWLLSGRPETRLFEKMMNHEATRDEFVTIVLDLLNSRFEPETVKAKIQALTAEIEQEMPATIARWKHIKDMDTYRANVQEIADFADERPAIVRADLKEHLGLLDSEEIRLQVKNVGDAGTMIKVNTLTIEEADWSGTYFSGMPIRIEIEKGAAITDSETLKRVRETEHSEIYELVPDGDTTIWIN